MQSSTKQLRSAFPQKENCASSIYTSVTPRRQSWFQTVTQLGSVKDSEHLDSTNNNYGVAREDLDTNMEFMKRTLNSKKSNGGDFDSKHMVMSNGRDSGDDSDGSGQREAVIMYTDVSPRDGKRTTTTASLKTSSKSSSHKQEQCFVQTNVSQTQHRICVTSSSQHTIGTSSSSPNMGGHQFTTVCAMSDADLSGAAEGLFPVSNRSLLALDCSSDSGQHQFTGDPLDSLAVARLDSSGRTSPASASHMSSGRGSVEDALSLLRQCEKRQQHKDVRRGTLMDDGVVQRHFVVSPTECLDMNQFDPMDLAIEATLQKTVDTFRGMVEQQREELVRMFPQLSNVRTTAMADQGPGTEVVTETHVQPDGSILEVKRMRTRQVLRMHKSVSIVNGVVQNSTQRAVMEYQGPGGGYRLKIEDDSTAPAQDSETEEDDESDRASVAPSEFGDTESVMVVTTPPKSKRVDSPKNTELVPYLQVSPKRKTEKAWYAAQELVETERRYVEKLKLLDQIFRSRVVTDPDTAKTIGGDKLAKLFSNMSTLYAFHNEHLLPQLESRLREWQQTQKMYDVVRRLAPFLKIYSEYTGNYKKATKTYEELRKKNKRFAAIIDEIEKMPECDHLPLASHIICPVQRITRYHLLMTEYLKHLHDGHPDKADTIQALELTKEAAEHANQMMRQLDKYKNVIDVQEWLGSQIRDLVTPSRELVKQGRLMKISARNGEHQPRYVFLFNDMMLLCSERRSMVMTAWGGKYKLRAIFEVDGMHVLEGDNLDIENTFYVRSGNKTVELYTSSSSDKTEWMATLWSVIQDYNKRMQSFQKREEQPVMQSRMDSSQTDLASTAVPALAPAPAAAPAQTTNNNRCSVCSAVYNPFKKEYVCKSCGASLCKKCCCHKIKLNEGEKPQRVCSQCHDRIKSLNQAPSTESEPSDSRKMSLAATTIRQLHGKNRKSDAGLTPQQASRKSIVQVKPSDSCIWSGYLEMKTSNRKTWEKRYFALHQDFVLYSFANDKDASAKTSLPITGCSVCWVDPKQDSMLSSKDINAFKLEHKNRVYYLKAASPHDMAKWVAALELASQAQLPSATGA